MLMTSCWWQNHYVSYVFKIIRHQHRCACQSFFRRGSKFDFRQSQEFHVNLKLIHTLVPRVWIYWSLNNDAFQIYRYDIDWMCINNLTGFLSFNMEYEGSIDLSSRLNEGWYFHWVNVNISCLTLVLDEKLPIPT